MSNGGTTASRVLRSSPYFPVADVEASLAYYEKVLGFPCQYRGGSPPIFGICARDGFGVMLRKVADRGQIVPNERQGGTWDAFFWITDARGLHAELAAKGADVVYAPIVQDSYNMLEFAVRDCDGHVLGFGQSLG